MFATYITKTPEETIQLGQRLAQRLVGGDAVLLVGELGTGKTHFTKGLAAGIGILMTIKSPTYTYVNKFLISDLQLTPDPYQYPTKNPKSEIRNPKQTQKSKTQNLKPKLKTFYHYDLYRLKEGDDFTSIGLHESFEDSDAITVVEWADRLGGHFPKQYIIIQFTEVSEGRKIEIEFHRPTILDEWAIEAYYDEWATPMHVREHCRIVTHVAMEVARAMMRKGEIINATLLYTSGMLHDMARVCDMMTFGRDKIHEPISKTKWSKWLKLREQYSGKKHPEIAYHQLQERGFSETAEVIRLHQTISMGNEMGAFDTIEKKLINYADKRVKHREIVSIQERFRDGNERYGSSNSPELSQLFVDLEQATLEMERELFRGLDIKQGDITK